MEKHFAALPAPVQAHIATFYASPERTPAAFCDVKAAVRRFRRQRARQRARRVLYRRLMERLQRMQSGASTLHRLGGP